MPAGTTTIDDRVYRRTEKGAQAFETQDKAVPSDYRRILGVVESATHADVIRGYLRRFSDALLRDWLAELEELGLLESEAASGEHDLDFTGPLGIAPGQEPALIPDDAKTIEREAKSIGAKLARSGASIAEDRLKNRASLGKPPEDTDVLIVEDDPDQRSLAELRVRMAGYQVRSVSSAAGLAAALQSKTTPDILLLDVMLPDGDGFDILSGLRRHRKFALLTVVMLTAKDEPGDVRKGLALGADAYITKPYSKNILADTIRRVLKQPPQK